MKMIVNKLNDDNDGYGILQEVREEYDVIERLQQPVDVDFITSNLMILMSLMDD